MSSKQKTMKAYLLSRMSGIGRSGMITARRHPTLIEKELTNVEQDLSSMLAGNADIVLLTGNASGDARHFARVRFLKGEGELFITADQTFCVMKILDAIYESNRTGKAVCFDSYAKVSMKPAFVRRIVCKK